MTGAKFAEFFRGHASEERYCEEGEPHFQETLHQAGDFKACIAEVEGFGLLLNDNAVTKP